MRVRERRALLRSPPRRSQPPRAVSCAFSTMEPPCLPDPHESRAGGASHTAIVHATGGCPAGHRRRVRRPGTALPNATKTPGAGPIARYSPFVGGADRQLQGGVVPDLGGLIGGLETIAITSSSEPSRLTRILLIPGQLSEAPRGALRTRGTDLCLVHLDAIAMKFAHPHRLSALPEPQMELAPEFRGQRPRKGYLAELSASARSHGRCSPTQLPGRRSRLRSGRCLA